MHNDIIATGSKERLPMLAPELVTPAVLAEGDNQGQPQVVRQETYINTTLENRKLIDAKAEAIHMILNEIRDNICSIVDACSSAKEIIPKRIKDYEYYKEKMMLCKQESKGIPLSAEQDEWLHDIDEELDKQELEAHYMYMAKIQEVLHAVDDNSGPTYDVEPLEKVHTNNDYNVFANETQHYEPPESIKDTYLVEKTDRNDTLDSSNMCHNEGKVD
ncbi:hypothetical protein Tco_0580961 [Tanacetum coccineum]